ncbi:hypothetical protein BH23PLA1_BH23PLA1_40020 [soil metagenome]
MAPHRVSDKEQAWRSHLEQFATSGQSIRQFCAEHQLHARAFTYWRDKCARLDDPAAHRPTDPPASAHPAFAKVVVRPPTVSPADDCLRLRLGAVRELLLPASWPIDHVAALLRAIEDQPSIAGPSIIGRVS